VIGGSNRRCRQYSASLGTVHVEKCRPRSAGLDRAMSISSRTWGPAAQDPSPWAAASELDIRLRPGVYNLVRTRNLAQATG
jgi:hypothetical protein